MALDPVCIELYPISYELNGTEFNTTARIIHLDIPPFDPNSSVNELENDKPIVMLTNHNNNQVLEEEIYPSYKNPFADEFNENDDSLYNEPEPEESVYVNNEPVKSTIPDFEINNNDKTDKDSGVHLDLASPISRKPNEADNKNKFPAFKSKNHNFNPFGSDTDHENEEDENISQHSKKVLNKKKDYFFSEPINCANLSEPEISNKNKQILTKKKYSMIEEPIYDGSASIYSTCKRRAPVPPKLSDKEILIIDLIDLNSQLTSLELVSQKINHQVEERESQYMEFSLENQSLIDNRNSIITKKFELYTRLAELSPFDKRVFKLKKIVSKKKNTHEASIPLFKWRIEKERDMETQYLYEMKSSQRCYSTHLERKQTSRPKLSNFLSTLSRSSSVYGSNRSLSSILKFDNTKTNQ